jgi:hypothetical protein
LPWYHIPDETEHVISAVALKDKDCCDNHRCIAMRTFSFFLIKSSFVYSVNSTSHFLLYSF